MVLESSDCFQYRPVPNLIPKSQSCFVSGCLGLSNTHPQQSQWHGFGHNNDARIKPNLDLCRELVEWHIRCCPQKNIRLKQVTAPAQVYFLERALIRLRALSIDDYKRAYTEFASTRLKTIEKHRLLDYCRTRTTRWEHLRLSYSRMVGEFLNGTRFEADATQEILRVCGGGLQQLAQQVEDQLHKTREFVKLQLDYIEADQ